VAAALLILVTADLISGRDSWRRAKCSEHI
jgi:hypothetical protein